jgi:hypothetical protein
MVGEQFMGLLSLALLSKLISLQLLLS